MAAAAAQAAQEAPLTPGQEALVLLLCFLPLFTSLAVLILGLFADPHSKRRLLLRNQLAQLEEVASNLRMQKAELEVAIQADLEGADLEGADLEALRATAQTLRDWGAKMGVYTRLSPAQELNANPDQLSNLSAEAMELLELEQAFHQLEQHDGAAYAA